MLKTPLSQSSHRLGRRIAAEVLPYWGRMLVIALIHLIDTPLALLAPIPLKIAVDNVIQTRPLPAALNAILPAFARGNALALLATAAILHILIVFASQLQDLCGHVAEIRTGELITFRFRAKLFGHAQRLSLLFHDRRGTSDSIYRIQYDATSLQYILLNGVIPLLGAAVTLAGTVYVTVRIDRELALIALAVSPLLYLVSRTFRRRMRAEYRIVKTLESSALRIIQEALTSLRVIKAFGREESSRRRFMDESSKGVDARSRLAAAEGTFSLLINLVTAAGTAAVLYVGIRNVLSGVLTLGELLMVMTYLTQLYAPLKTISKSVGTLQSSVASAERTFELLDQAPDVPERPGARHLVRAEGAVEFANLTFSYEQSIPVLRDVTLSIPSGTRVGIVGKTGAGKTTLMNLLMRFYDPVSGAILLDGTDIRDYRLADFRNQFAVVPQEPLLFSTTIAENIALALPGADENMIIDAAVAANAHDFIVRLAHGYGEVVGERGMTLSGGERQRISLARAFLKNAPILILDEPTSAVDTHTERMIVDALTRLARNRTTFIIAHRLTTLASVDMVVALEGGKVISASSGPGAVGEHDWMEEAGIVSRFDAKGGEQ